MVNRDIERLIKGLAIEHEGMATHTSSGPKDPNQELIALLEQASQKMKQLVERINTRCVAHDCNREAERALQFHFDTALCEDHADKVAKMHDKHVKKLSKLIDMKKMNNMGNRA